MTRIIILIATMSVFCQTQTCEDHDGITGNIPDGIHTAGREGERIQIRLYCGRDPHYSDGWIRVGGSRELQYSYNLKDWFDVLDRNGNPVNFTGGGRRACPSWDESCERNQHVYPHMKFWRLKSKQPSEIPVHIIK